MLPTATLDRLRHGGVWRQLRELTAFGVVGAVCFLIDVAVFHVLYAYVGVDAVVTKFLATTISMTAAFVGHRSWSFPRSARTGLRRQYLRFAVINGATLLLGLVIVGLVRYPLGQESALVLQGANVFSICIGTVVRFVSYRLWVFPALVPPAADPVTEPAPGAGTGAEPAASLG